MIEVVITVVAGGATVFVAHDRHCTSRFARVAKVASCLVLRSGENGEALALRVAR
jgi:hypothetical protein